MSHVRLIDLCHACPQPPRALLRSAHNTTHAGRAEQWIAEQVLPVVSQQDICAALVCRSDDTCIGAIPGQLGAPVNRILGGVESESKTRAVKNTCQVFEDIVSEPEENTLRFP